MPYTLHDSVADVTMISRDLRASVAAVSVIPRLIAYAAMPLVTERLGNLRVSVANVTVISPCR